MSTDTEWANIDFRPAPPGWRLAYTIGDDISIVPMPGWLIQEECRRAHGEDYLTGQRRIVAAEIDPSAHAELIEAVEVWKILAPGEPDPSAEEIAAVSTTAETQLAVLRAELERERTSRQDWAAEAMRLDVENEQLRAELATAHADHSVTIRLSSIDGATTDPDVAQPVCPDCDSEQALFIDLDANPRPSDDDGWHIVTLHNEPCPRTAEDRKKLLAGGQQDPGDELREATP